MTDTMPLAIIALSGQAEEASQSSVGHTAPSSLAHLSVSQRSPAESPPAS